MPSPGSTVSHPQQADLDTLILALLDGGVEFIVVGGAAAVLQGAPITRLVVPLLLALLDKRST